VPDHCHERGPELRAWIVLGPDPAAHHLLDPGSPRSAEGLTWHAAGDEVDTIESPHLEGLEELVGVG